MGSRHNVAVADAQDGLVIIRDSSSAHAETLAALQRAIAARGLTLFCRIDHAAGARDAGLELPSEDVLLFCNPKAGTSLMEENPVVGYELPLRILVWQQGERAKIGYRDPRELAGEYDLKASARVLERMATLLAELASEAAS
jgi:uncharacterized protein (DUF302 family)